jgi:toxin ParE1/3/4
VNLLPIVLRELAARDIERVVDHYVTEGAIDAALGFIDAIEGAFARIGRHPAAGSTRYAEDLSIPGLRSWVLATYPYVVFYAAGDDHVDVWRVLHGHMDIPVRMSEP